MKNPLAILLVLFSFVSAQETIAVLEFEGKGISQVPPSGKIEFNINVPGATIKILNPDGSLNVHREIDGYQAIVTLPPGPYEYNVLKSGYHSVTGRILVQIGKYRFQNVKLINSNNSAPTPNIVTTNPGSNTSPAFNTVTTNPGSVWKSYSLVGIRSYESNFSSNDLRPYIYYDADPFQTFTLTDVTRSGKTLLLGFGIKRYSSGNQAQRFWNTYVNAEWDNLEYHGIETQYLVSQDTEGSFYWRHWSVGLGYGKVSNSLSTSAAVEFNFGNKVDDYDEYVERGLQIPAKPFVSFKITVGFTNPNRNPWGVYYSKPIGKHFINSGFPKISANQLNLEMPVLGGVAILLAGAAANAGVGSEPLLGSKEGCQVFGRIRFVEAGEDYKVRFVNAGEDLRVQYVSVYPNSVGKWQVVEVAEDYRIKIVQAGEDIRVREVIAGEGCGNQISKFVK